MIVQFSRRKLMIGAGASAVVLPVLESLMPRSARAQATAPKKRLLVVNTPNGTPQSNWFPTGGETDFKLGPILSPLEQYRSDLLIVDGLDSKAADASNGDPHGVGFATMLNGAKTLPGTDFLDGGCLGSANCRGTGWGGAISVDQMVAQKLVNDKAVINGSLNFSIKNVPGSLWTRMSYSAPGKPLTPEADPGAAFDRIFGGVAPSSTTADQRVRIRQRQQSALDDITAEFARLNSRLGSADRTRLDAHLTAVRALEDRIARSEALTGGLKCTAPMKHDIGPGVAVDRNVGGMETNNNAKNETDLQDRHTIWREMTVRALACDLTRVVTVMFAPSRADTYMPWLGFSEPHHALSHDNNVDKLTKINNWYATLIGQYVTDIKKEVDENGDSLFKNTVLFWVNELGFGAGHTFNQIPYLIVGSAGGFFKTGRYVKYPNGTAHNVVLTAIAQSMDVPTDHVGDAAYKGGNVGLLKGG